MSKPNEPKDPHKQKGYVADKLKFFKEQAKKEEKAKKDEQAIREAAKARRLQAEAKAKAAAAPKEQTYYFTVSELVQSFPEKAPAKILAALKEGNKKKEFEKVYSEFLQNLKKSQDLEKEFGGGRQFKLVGIDLEKSKQAGKKTLNVNNLSLNPFVALLGKVKQHAELLFQKKAEKEKVKSVSSALDRFDQNLEKALRHTPRGTSTLKDERAAMREILEKMQNLPADLNPATKLAIQEMALTAILHSLGSERRFGFSSSKEWIPDALKEKKSVMANYVNAMLNDIKEAN
jgi:hypothetical protein